MSVRQKRLAFVGLCLLTINACDSKQAPANVAAEPVQAVAAAPAQKTEAVKVVTEVAAPADPFLLDTALSATDTFESLQTKYGKENVVKSELPGAEGETAQGWAIFKDSPDKQLLIYPDESDQHPSSVLVSGAESQWHFSNGIKMGSSIQSLESLNKKSFEFYGFYWDYGGAIKDWKKGEREKFNPNGLHLSLHLCPPEKLKLPDDYLSGDATFKSDDPLAKKFPPVVCELGFNFPQPE